ncbi:MAG: carbohydrate kinase family protein [Gemmatimonadaceae bacterium]|nr:carbohydrate kinase family protein [Gemmatimonadaceae bacterium]
MTAPRRKRLGVIGTFVWDVIHGRDIRTAPVEEWGGITYALSALDAALTEEWEIVPLIKVGADLHQKASEFVRSLKRAAPDAALIAVPQANNRVELRYVSDERRTEVLTGGVPPWSWLGLRPLLADLDALYVNFIAGWELDLETMQLLRAHVPGPIYCDLHSKLLGVDASGLRIPEPMADAAAWCRCADVMQVNEDEMELMAPDPMALAATALASGVHLLCVTLGRKGAVYFAAPGFATLRDIAAPVTASAFAAVRTALVPIDPELLDADPGDPTGCGDVWGATQFSHLLAGTTFTDAMRQAHRAAARNVRHRGATGLAHYLRGELAPS